MTDKPLTNQEVEEGLVLAEKYLPAKQGVSGDWCGDVGEVQLKDGFNLGGGRETVARATDAVTMLNILPRALRELKALRAELEASPIRRILSKKER